MRLIETQRDMDEMLEFFLWEDAFIREAHVLSMSYVRDKVSDVSVVAPDVAPQLRVLVCAPDRRTPALELVFDGADNVMLPFCVDLEPKGVVSRDRVEFSFSPVVWPIIAEQLHYELLDTSAWEDRLRYGKSTADGES
jgi:hypothetical protein